MTGERIDDVVVVGGGIIGCAIAREAARAGLRVHLLEKGAIGGEASGAAAGLLCPQAEADPDDPLFGIGLASRDLYPEFVRQVAEESGIDPALSERGTLLLARPGPEADGLDRTAASQRALGLAAERLSGEPLRRMEPGVHPDWSEGLYLPRDWSIDNAVLMRALEVSAARGGARIQSGVRVDRFLVEGGRVAGVMAGGERVRAGAVVVAAGAWTSDIGGPGIPPLPSSPVRGQIVCFGPAPAPAGALYTHGFYLVPRRDGRVLAGSTMERAGFDKSVTGSGLASLSASALALVPALGGAPLHSVWAGLRPATPDERPAIGRAQAPGLLYACGHLRSGILLAPLTARVIGRLLREEDPGMDLSPFDPRRFSE